MILQRPNSQYTDKRSTQTFERSKGIMTNTTRISLHKSLIGRLVTALTWVVLVTVAGMALFTFLAERHALAQELETQLVLVSDLKKDQIENWLLNRQADARLLAQNMLNQEHFTELFNPSIAKARKVEFTAFLADNLIGVQNARQGYTRIVIADATGTIIIATDPGLVGHSLAIDPAFLGVMSAPSGQFIQDAHINPDTQATEMTFGHVMRAVDLKTFTELPKTIGVLLITVNVDTTIFPMISTWPGMGRTGEISLVRLEGNQVRMLNVPRASHAKPMSTVWAKPSSTDPVYLAAKGEEGVIQTADSRQTQILAVYRTIPETQWGFVAQKDLNEIFAPVYALGVQFGLIALVAVLLSGLVAVLVSRSLIRPLAQLMRGTQAVIAGDLSAQISVSSSDEIGALADSFRSMLRSLAQRERQLKAADESSRGILELHSLDEVLSKITYAARDLVGAECAALVIYDERGAPEHVISTDETVRGDLLKQELTANRGLLQTFSRNKREIPLPVSNTPDGSVDPALISPNAILGVPIVGKDQPMGLLYLTAQPGDRGFGKTDEQILTSLAAYAAVALTNARLVEQLQELNLGLESQVRERTQELVAANTRLMALDELKSKFVSNVSHELRTPVTNLRLYLSLLEKGNPTKRADYLNTLKEQVNLLGTLIEEILNLSSLESQREDHAWQTVDVNALVERIIQVHSPRAELAGLDLSFQPAPEPATVLGNPDQLAQVVTNLVVNALNYTPAGSVAVRTAIQDSQVFFEVKDTGIGIAPGDIPHVFDRFYRGELVTQHNISGTGLGLGIVKEIVTQHNGTVQVLSEVGKGSCFGVVLPYSAQSEPSPADQEMAGREARPRVFGPEISLPNRAAPQRA